MVIDISVAIISICFAILSAYLILSIHTSRKYLNQIRKDINDLSNSGLELTQNLNELTEDLKKKSESLNFIFRFVDGFKSKKPAKISHGGARLQKNTEHIAEIVDIVGSGLDLFGRIKSEVKKFSKHK